MRYPIKRLLEKKDWQALAIGVIVMIAAGIWIINWASFDIQRIRGDEVIAKSTSPNGEYTVTAYLNNGGATVDFAVLATVKHNSSGKVKNIYWEYHCYSASIVWLDNQTVSINGVGLNVLKDIYDYRYR